LPIAEYDSEIRNRQLAIDNQQSHSVSSRSLTLHLASGVLNRFDDVLIAGTPA
jgi:hypothetical protein